MPLPVYTFTMRNALVSAFVSSADLEFRPMTLIYELDLYIYVKGHFVLELLSEHTHTHTHGRTHIHTQSADCIRRPLNVNVKVNVTLRCEIFVGYVFGVLPVSSTIFSRSRRVRKGNFITSLPDNNAFISLLFKTRFSASANDSALRLHCAPTWAGDGKSQRCAFDSRQNIQLFTRSVQTG